MKKKSMLQRNKVLTGISCLVLGLLLTSCGSDKNQMSNAVGGTVAESQETVTDNSAHTEESTVEEREKTPIELIAEVEDPVQRYEQASKMYSGIKKKVSKNMEDAKSLLKIMAKSSNFPKTDYNARKDEVKGILDDFLKKYGGSYCFVNFDGNEISWIGVYDEKGNGIVRKDYANRRTDLYHYEYDADGNILYSEHGVINDGTEAIVVRPGSNVEIVVPNDGKEVIVETGDRYEYDAQGRVTRIIGDFDELHRGSNFIALSYHYSSNPGEFFQIYDFGEKEHADEQGYEITYDDKGDISKIKWNYVYQGAAKDAEYETKGKGDEYFHSFKWNAANPKESYFALSHRDDGTLDKYVYDGWQYISDKSDSWAYIQGDSREPIKVSKNSDVEFIQKARGFEHRNFIIKSDDADEWQERIESAFELKKWQLACLQYDSAGEKAYIETYRTSDYPGEKLRLHTWSMKNNRFELVMDVSKLTDDFTIYEVYRITYDDWKEVKEITQEAFLIYQLPEEAQESGWIYEEHDTVLSPEFQYLMKY